MELLTVTRYLLSSDDCNFPVVIVRLHHCGVSPMSGSLWSQIAGEQTRYRSARFDLALPTEDCPCLQQAGGYPAILVLSNDRFVEG